MRRQGDKTEVLDPVRGQWVHLGPEEWVRQHLLCHLIEHIGVPRGLISVERSAGRGGRYDVAVYDRRGRQRAVFECKAPTVSLSSATLYQAVRYLQRPGLYVLGITNGLRHFYWVRPPGAPTVRSASEIPRDLGGWLRHPPAS